MRLRTFSLDKDPYIDYVPLSYKKYQKDSFVGVLKSDTELIGLARIYYNKSSISVELADIFLMDDYRGKKFNGVKFSHLLISKIINSCKRRKIKQIWLWTTNDNIPAIKLYEFFGFKNIKVSDNFKSKINKKYPFTKKVELIKMNLNIGRDQDE